MNSLLQSFVFLVCASTSVFITFSSTDWSTNLKSRLNINSKQLVKLSAKDTSDLGLFFSNSKIDSHGIELRADRAIKSYPFSYTPLISKGLTSYALGKPVLSEKLLKLAQMRNPRSERAGLSLFSIYYDLKDYESAIKQADLLMRIEPAQAKAYIKLLSNISDIPESQNAIKMALKEDPKWADKFLTTRLNTSNDDNYLIDLVSLWTNSTRDKRKTKPINRRLVSKLISSKNLGALRRYKARLSEDPMKHKIIDDPDFTGQSVLPSPLTWSLIKSNRNFAEFNEIGGLSVGYAGVNETTLASQIFWLPENSNSFDVTVDIKLDSDREPGSFELRINCNPSNETLFSSVLMGGNKIGTFTKPNKNCESYTIEIVAIPGDLIKRLSAEVYKINIIPTREQ